MPGRNSPEELVDTHGNTCSASMIIEDAGGKLC